jgi:pimeloyl-ACP methyl ester carboxylesterase
VIALDLPGFGYSPMPAEKISISGYARTIGELCDVLDIAAAALVGNSMGGFISAELAICDPARVDRLVLVSAAGISIENQSYPTGAMHRVEGFLAAYTAWVASKSEFVSRRSRLRQATLYSVMRHPGRLPAPLAAEQLRGSGKPGFIDALDALMSYPIRDRLSEISCPTLIVWGRRDWLVPVKDADKFERLIPNSRKVVYEGTGHMAMLERPAAFNALVDEFLAE